MKNSGQIPGSPKPLRAALELWFQSTWSCKRTKSLGTWLSLALPPATQKLEGESEQVGVGQSEPEEAAAGETPRLYPPARQRKQGGLRAPPADLGLVGAAKGLKLDLSPESSR